MTFSERDCDRADIARDAMKDRAIQAARTQWYPWNATGMEARSIRAAWDLACDWLRDFGIDLQGDGAELPDALAYTDKACIYAFRLDQNEGGPSVVVVVEIDEDPPARAVRVEVKRG